jgi:hypothetical protein
VAKGQADGARLFRVAESIYTVLIVLNWIVGIGGGIGAIVAAVDSAPIAALGVLLFTAVICVINYAVAVLTTHGAKVLVHLLFANLALLSKEDAR